jgi:hypothetical protein
VCVAVIRAGNLSPVNPNEHIKCLKWVSLLAVPPAAAADELGDSDTGPMSPCHHSVSFSQKLSIKSADS